MKKLVSSILLTAGLLPAMSFAADQANKLTLQGEVVSSTCSVKINYNDITVITLPTVPASSLAQAGQTAGDTSFVIMISDCPNQTRARAWMDPDSPNGNILNSAGTATNVEIRLVDPYTNEQVGGTDKKSDYSGFGSNNGAVIPLTAQYYATGAATGGTVEGSTVFYVEYE